MIKTYEEYQNQKRERDKNNPSQNKNNKLKKKNKKEKIEIIRNKWFYLIHPDFPIVSNCEYILDEKYELEINENGCIIVDNESIRDRLIENNFYFVGTKNKED